jgi:zinc transporter ZupT
VQFVCVAESICSWPLEQAYSLGLHAWIAPGSVISRAIQDWPRRFVFEYAALAAFLFFCIQRESDRYSTRSKEDRTSGRIIAALLILHSTLDGTAIFAATTISLQMGLIVGLGIVAHDICD